MEHLFTSKWAIFIAKSHHIEYSWKLRIDTRAYGTLGQETSSLFIFSGSLRGILEIQESLHTKWLSEPTLYNVQKWHISIASDLNSYNFWTTHIEFILKLIQWVYNSFFIAFILGNIILVMHMYSNKYKTTSQGVYTQTL